MDAMIETTLYSDPACPWAYSESPALRVIEWRYGEQLHWRLVLVGLTESASQDEQRGYTPRAVRDAVLAGAKGATERHLASLPGSGGGAARRPGQRVAGVPHPPARELHHAAGARR